jgi:phosphatidylglycerophosphate synthase
MRIERKRKIEEIYFGPIAKHINVNPNWITFISIIAMLFAGFAIFQSQLAIAAAFILLSGALDALDGLVAKKHHRETAFGAMFDRTADRINDAIPIVAITLFGYVVPFNGFMVLILIMLASYMSACMEAHTRTRIGETISLRPLRTAVLVVACILPFADSLVYAMLLLMIIGLYSVLSRFCTAAQILT